MAQGPEQTCEPLEGSAQLGVQPQSTFVLKGCLLSHNNHMVSTVEK